MKTITVRKRFGPELLDVREFIRPNAIMVARHADMLRRRSRNVPQYIDLCLNYVVRQIALPTGSLLTRDWHQLYAYRNADQPTPVLSYSANDFWNYPGETMAWRVGDCDDKSILLCSLLRRHLGANAAYCTVGTYRGAGHMWVTIWRGGSPAVLETTRRVDPVPEVAPYSAMFRFNDRRTIILRELQDTPLVGGGSKWR